MKFINILYKGQKLGDYCRDNSINFNTLRINFWRYRNEKNYREMYSSYSDEELIDYIIKKMTTKHMSNNIKFFYRGEPLLSYCEKHPEYTYNSIIIAIARARKKDPSRSVDDILDEYFSKKMERCNLSKYMYKGETLRSYCEKKGYNYNTIISSIRRKLIDRRFADYTLSGVIDYVVSSYKPKMKLYYKSIPLINYCNDNGYSYTKVIRYINKHLPLNNQTMDELIEEAFESGCKANHKLRYNNMSLKQYCKFHNMCYGSLITKIHFMRKENPEEDIDKIIDSCIKSYRNKSNKYKYLYRGIPLITYCDKNKITYSNLIRKYKLFYRPLNIPMETAFDELVRLHLFSYGDKKYYKVNGVYLEDYCKKNNYPYEEVYNKIDRMVREKNTEPIDSIVKIVLSDYKIKNKLLLVSDDMDLLKENRDINTATKICNKLNLHINYVISLYSDGFTLYQAINAILYFYDKVDESGYPLVTDNRLSILNDLSCRLDNSCDYKKLSMKILVGLHKCGLYNSTVLVMKKQYLFIKNLSDNFNGELYNLLKEYYAEAIDTCMYISEEDITNYINNYVKDKYLENVKAKKLALNDKKEL